MKWTNLCLFVFALWPRNAAQAQSPPCERCNVVLLAFDAWSMKPDPSGSEFAKLAPHISAYLKEAAFFREGISASSWTFPSFFSILSSTYPSYHGMTNHFEEYSAAKKVVRTLKHTSPDLLLLSHFFRRHGYRTGAFTGGAAVSRKFGFHEGFDKFTETASFGGLDKSGAEAVRWIARKSQKPFFAFVHTYDLHGQGPTGPDGEDEIHPGRKAYVSLRERTLAKGNAGGFGQETEAKWVAWHEQKLRETDAKFAHFLKTLGAATDLGKTVVVLVSDHGSELLEHGGLGHGHSLYEELIRVPLAFHGPGIAARALDGQVSTLDIFPTVAALTGNIPDSREAGQLEGISLAASLLGDARISSRDLFSETEYRDTTFKTAVRSPDGWKYILDLVQDHEELFQLTKDPEEKTNLAGVEGNDKKLVALREKVTLFRKKYSSRRFGAKVKTGS